MTERELLDELRTKERQTIQAQADVDAAERALRAAKHARILAWEEENAAYERWVNSV